MDSLIIEGGFEYDGKRLAEFDEAACRAFFEGVKGRVEAVAVSSVFTVRNDDELRATIARGCWAGVTCPSPADRLDGPDRARVLTILNAALYTWRKFTRAAASLADKEGRDAGMYLSQNDGTLMTMNTRRYPSPIACGPTNSIAAPATCRAATAISSSTWAAPPRPGRSVAARASGVAVTIGGVRTNCMPDVVSIGLGGGYRALADDGSVTVGPDSVAAIASALFRRRYDGHRHRRAWEWLRWGSLVADISGLAER
ncbi:MAG: hypothetical protein ACLSVD_10210 [Eggerthellaceae bacterium]